METHETKGDKQGEPGVFWRTTPITWQTVKQTVKHPRERRQRTLSGSRKDQESRQRHTETYRDIGERHRDIGERHRRQTGNRAWQTVKHPSERWQAGGKQ
jgi:hypothetical protein